MTGQIQAPAIDMDVDRFWRDGFLTAPAVFSKGHLDALRVEADRLLALCAGAPERYARRIEWETDHLADDDRAGMDKADPAYKGQAGYNAAMLAIYDVWVLGFMSRAVWKVPVAQGVDRYRQHMGHRHLDVGPGTGYFIEKADPPRDTAITLLDPNRTVLRQAAKRLEERHPVTVEADVMTPLPGRGPSGPGGELWRWHGDDAPAVGRGRRGGRWHHPRH